MKYCPKCGNPMNDDALFCTKCGNKYTESPQREKNHKKHQFFYCWKKSNNPLKYLVFFIPIAILLFIIINSTICFHDWQIATCTKAETCLSCRKEKGEPLGHVWIEATCENAKYCETCKKIDKKPLGHTFIGTDCTRDGYCSRCNKKESAYGHIWTEATCENAKHCSVCGYVEGSPLEHEWIEPTCETARTCSLCDKIEGEPLEHSWIEATCLLPKTCSLCDKKEGSALGHVFGDWKVSKKATCGSDGIEKSTCSVCSEERTRSINKTGEHIFGDWRVRNNPTCTVNGARVKTCTVCKQQKVEGIEATGHDFKDDIIKEATYYEAGTKGLKCSKCGKEDGSTYTYQSFYKTKLSSIFSDYRKNEISAKEKYEDMYIEFTATIREIEASGSFSSIFSDYGTIKFEINNGTWLTDDAYCTIKDKTQLENAKELSVGQKVTIKGKINYASYYSSFIELRIDIIEIV